MSQSLALIITRLEKAAIPPVNPRMLQEIVIDLRQYEREVESEAIFEIVAPLRPSYFPM